ncbi:High-affinity nickel transport protein [Cedecea neteri]|uniref:Nickel/cobalt efflux system n=1 Tax=Cedecea neteri TaxID=158822 RepID=A0A2X2T2Q0_9ENTR|nr:High-affinity nickel transport protein [Cedecea neteri]
MYLVGFLFGLGFDTRHRNRVLGISAASASSGMSIWSILVFPALFASGMALIDTLDNVIMVGAYGWAFNKPQRKLYYNMTITGTSVVVALFIGGLEALGLLADKFGLEGGIWQWVGALNDNLGNAGFVVVGPVYRLLGDFDGELPLERVRRFSGEIKKRALSPVFLLLLVTRLLPRLAQSLRPGFSPLPQSFPAPAHSSCACTGECAATACPALGRSNRPAPSARRAFSGAGTAVRW